MSTRHKKKMTFALFFGHRGPFTGKVIASARKELSSALQEWGYETLMLDKDATAYGGVETAKEGQVYANFLHQNQGKFDGIILCLPNFGDENGAAEALKNAGVPILIQAYPDKLEQMDSALRRDAFCGKLSVMDVFNQYGIAFTALKPHVVNPTSESFKKNVDCFSRVCRVVQGLKGLVVGAIGARSTPFKTVRIDELTLQQHGIEVVTIDLSEVFARIRAISPGEKAYKDKAAVLSKGSCWEAVPEKAIDSLTRLGLALDAIVDEHSMGALALRCWTEMQTQIGISPCRVLGDLNERGIAAACEVDLGNAVMMKALSMAADQPPACLDWNNNYGDDKNKCILFHCGPVPPSLMQGEGKISDHPLLGRIVGMGIGYGCNTGRIAPCDMTFGSLSTDAGRVKTYLGQGEITNDPVPSNFFGCAGVAHIDRLEDVLIHIGRHSHRHHVSMTSGSVVQPVKEAFEQYLGFEVALPQ